MHIVRVQSCSHMYNNLLNCHCSNMMDFIFSNQYQDKSVKNVISPMCSGDMQTGDGREDKQPALSAFPPSVRMMRKDYDTHLLNNQ